MPQLTDTAPLIHNAEEQQRIVANIDELNSRLDELNALYSARLTREVEAMVPDLSGATQRALASKYPDFLTAARIELCRQNKKMFGLFKPEGYHQALQLLQAQFKAYLESTPVHAQLRDEIRRLVTERNRLQGARIVLGQQRQQLLRLQREVLMSPDDDDFSIDSVIAGDDSALNLLATMQLDTQPDGQDALQGPPAPTTGNDGSCIPNVDEQGHVACPAPEIATDDSLGYFS